MHTTQLAIAERDIIRIVNKNLTLFKNKSQATKCQKLRLTAVLVDNMEVLAKAWEDEMI